jgi:hypothetical protein
MRSEHIELIGKQFRRDFSKIKIDTIFLTSGEDSRTAGYMSAKARRESARVRSSRSPEARSLYRR